MTTERVLKARMTDDLDFTLSDIDARCAIRGINRSQFILQAVEAFLRFDDVFLEKIQARAKRLNIPVWLFIQNTMIKHFAIEAAEADVYGAHKKVLPEFLFTADGVITGQELFEMLKRSEISKLTAGNGVVPIREDELEEKSPAKTKGRKKTAPVEPKDDEWSSTVDIPEGFGLSEDGEPNDSN